MTELSSSTDHSESNGSSESSSASSEKAQRRSRKKVSVENKEKEACKNAQSQALLIEQARHYSAQLSDLPSRCKNMSLLHKFRELETLEKGLIQQCQTYGLHLE
jgi:hypothetical protein